MRERKESLVLYLRYLVVAWRLLVIDILLAAGFAYADFSGDAVPRWVWVFMLMLGLGVAPIEAFHRLRTEYARLDHPSAEPSFSVEPSADDRFWWLLVRNHDSVGREFRIDIVSVGSPVGWSRYTAPWRSLSSAQNRERLGWMDIPAGADAAVNLVSWVTKQENAQIFMGKIVERPEVLHVHSTSIEKGYDDFKIEQGDVIEFTVEARARESTAPMRLRYRLTVEADGLALVEIEDSLPAKQPK